MSEAGLAFVKDIFDVCEAGRYGGTVTHDRSEIEEWMLSVADEIEERRR